MPKPKTRKLGPIKENKYTLKYPTTRQDDTRRLKQALENSPMWVKNFVHRPSHKRRAPNNLSLLLTKELKKSPMWAKNMLYRPTRSRKTSTKMKKKLTNKPLTKPSLTNKPLGSKI